MVSKLYEVLNLWVRIMDFRGTADKGVWYVNVLGPTNTTLVPTDPVEPSVSATIEELISKAQDAGREGLIDRIVVSDRYAVFLFLEDRLTSDVLVNAIEDGGALVVNMNFGGKTRKIVIKSEEDLESGISVFQANDDPV